MEPVVIKADKRIYGTKYVETYKFKSGHEVPIYEILNCHGLNQMIGYVKLINKTYGKVFYRGQCNLHDTMLPSLYHKSCSARYKSERNKKLNSIIKKTLADEDFMKEVNLRNDLDEASIIIEGMLQHYGIETRCIDAVDNHWIALWFGLNKYHSERIGNNVYSSYTNRIKNVYQMFENEGKTDDKESCYQYVILIASDKGKEAFGVIFGNDILTVDLRVALPSTFLRPHAQHGIILKKRLHDCSYDFDISKSVVGILKIRNDLANSWLGDGELAKFSNLFPSQFHDHAYRILLEREDLFRDSTNSIVQYIYE